MFFYDFFLLKQPTWSIYYPYTRSDS